MQIVLSKKLCEKQKKMKLQKLAHSFSLFGLFFRPTYYIVCHHDSRHETRNQLQETLNEKHDAIGVHAVDERLRQRAARRQAAV